MAWGDPCHSLKGFVVPASSIGLPTMGARLDSTKHVDGVHGGYCKALGEIKPIDPTADPIRFEVNLPETWNKKAVQFGGGAFDGYLGRSDGRHGTVMSVAGAPTPLERGYATFGSDSGHHHHYLFLPDELNAVSATFALNSEQRHNFAQDQLKKTHDVSVALIHERYSAGPERMYFVGGSTGGREALKVVQNWPHDYDGVLAAYAAWNQIESDLQFIRVSQALYAKGSKAERGWVPKRKLKMLRNAVVEACDAQDGLTDGMISDPAACHFDPAVLQCADGSDDKKCLSAGQLRTVHTFATAQVTEFPVANGMTSMPGYNALAGADMTENMGLFRRPMHNPIVFLNAFYYVVGDGVLRYFLTRDKNFDALTFDVKAAGKWRAGVVEQSIEDDASNADLSAFVARGGKLLLVHGTVDATIPTNSSVDYYQRVVAKLGQEATDGFVRLYLIPGFSHEFGIFDAGFDSLTVLDDWATKKAAPKDLTVTDKNKRSEGRTRPMCAYPRWPRYNGAGNANLAGNFSCVTE